MKGFNVGVFGLALAVVSCETMNQSGSGSTPSSPSQKPQWNLTVDSKPSGAILSMNVLRPDGTLEFQTRGMTPKTFPWLQESEDDPIKV